MTPQELIPYLDPTKAKMSLEERIKYIQETGNYILSCIEVIDYATSGDSIAADYIHDTRFLLHEIAVRDKALESCCAFIFSQKYFDCSDFKEEDHWIDYGRYQVQQMNKARKALEKE